MALGRTQSALGAKASCKPSWRITMTLLAALKQSSAKLSAASKFTS